MQELDLYNHWLQYARQCSVIQLGRHRLRILHPGRLSLQRGPDFRSARFELDGVIYQGDVEFHLRVGDWYAHRHHLDHAYANVLLHLVGIPESNGAETVENRFSACLIPTFVLPRPGNMNQPVPASRYCRSGPRFRRGLKQRLERLACQRFENKTQRFLHLLGSFNPVHLLYHHIMRSLGYAGNETAFETVAHAITPALLEKYRSDPLRLYALYAGCAGFLNEEAPDHFTRLLGVYYAALREEIGVQMMQPEDWQTAGVRASNHPHFRLAGWVQLVSRTGMPGLFNALDAVFRERRSYDRLLPSLRTLFRSPVSGYWKTHSALGKSGNAGGRDFLGKARVDEILVNILLPFFAAFALYRGSEGHASYLREFYLWMPLDHPYTSMTMNFPWLDICMDVFPTQGLKQAILHLDASFCRVGRCQECPLKRVPAFYERD